MHDVDEIIAILEIEFPACQITQLKVTHPSDDDGLWFIKVPGKAKEIQIESSNGNCPFIIESSDSNERLEGTSTNDVLAKIRTLYS